MRGDLSVQHGTVEPRGVPEHTRGPLTISEREAIREHLERVLANPLFAHSRRYPNLLRYVVEQTLEGNSGDLKERTLGVKVFAREPEYDTNSDPVVRTTAGEIRKRLAQYYQETGDSEGVRIDLPAGSYVPEFHFPEPKPVAATPEPADSASPQPRRRARYAIAATVLVVTAAVLLVWKPWVVPTAVDRFWRPVLESSSSVMLCAGQRHFIGALPETPDQRDSDFGRFTYEGPPPSPAGPVTLFKLYYLGSQNVALPDVVTLGALDGLLQSRGKRCSIRGEHSTTFTDLRNGPVVLVGAFNNDWSLRLMGPLRFSFDREGDTFWIRDRQHPNQKNWAVDYSTPYLKLNQDYALISRVLDRRAERMIVVAGGLTGYGTMAAGEFLTNARYLSAIAAYAPKDWEQRNLQIVISAEVINGVSGPPRVVAVESW